MGYTSHRENVPNTNSTKKIAMWDNLKIKNDRIGQDRTGSESAKNLSCPSSLDIGKTEIGQDANSYVINKSISSIVEYNNSLNIVECSSDENWVKPVNSLTMDLSCPNMRFSDSGRHLTGYGDKTENHPVLDQKMINSEQSNEDYFVKKDKHIISFRTDLKNFVLSNYNGTVESVPDLLDDFNRRYPGYKQVLEHQDLKDEAEKLNSWGWK